MDYDNDGDQDLYVAISMGATSVQTDRLFRNEGDGSFADVTAAAGPLASDAPAMGASSGDYDADGDLDLYLANCWERSSLFQNAVGNANNWLQVRLAGEESNSDGIGARIRVVCGELRQVQEMSAGGGPVVVNRLPAHFGLGSAAAVDSLTVRWPSGFTQIVSPPPAVNTLVTVAECGRLFVDATSGPLGDTGHRGGVGGLRQRRRPRPLRGQRGANKLLRNDGEGRSSMSRRAARRWQRQGQRRGVG